MSGINQIRLILFQKFLRHINTRRGPLQPPFELGYRQIFIIPSWFGIGFGILILLMTLAALNYNNNLALILSYLLLAIYLLVSSLGYRNLRGIKLFPAISEGVFAGETATFKIRIESPAMQRFALECWQDECCDQVSINLDKDATLVIRKTTTKRGQLSLGPWKLQSFWPFGFYRVWSWIMPADKCLVYPSPADNPPPLPHAGKLHSLSSKQQRGDDDELNGLREYVGGDPLNRIAWRSSARADHLITRETESQQGDQVVLDWESLDGQSIESRLSILTAWALQAEQLNFEWSLKLPQIELSHGKGPEHLHQALAQLALFNE